MRLSQKGNLSSAGIHSSSPPLLAVPCLLPCTPPNHLGGGLCAQRQKLRGTQVNPLCLSFPFEIIRMALPIS